MFCRPFNPALACWLAFASWAVPATVGATQPGTAVELTSNAMSDTRPDGPLSASGSMAAETAGPFQGSRQEATSRPVGAGPFRVKRWTTEQGLPQNRVACLAQTRDGYLWLGSWFGLARFDGVRFTLFNRLTTPALASDAINALAEDTEGTLWIGTRSGLLRYRDHQFEPVTNTWVLGQDIPRLAPCRTGGVWVQAGKWVGRLGASGCSRLWTLEPNGRATVRSLRTGADGWLNIYLARAWLALSPDGEEMRTNYLGSPASPELLAGWPDIEPGVSWVGTPAGLRRLSREGLQPCARNELGQSAVDFIAQDRAGRLWLEAHPGGLYCHQEQRWQALHLDQGSTLCLQEDQEGNIWVGTDLGLTRLQAPAVRTYTMRDGLADNQVLSVCEGNEGTLWAGTTHGLNGLRDGRVLALARAQPEASLSVVSVWPRQDGGVWLATPGNGLYEYRQGSFVHCLSEADSPVPSALYQDRSGRLWVGTSAGQPLAAEPGWRTNSLGTALALVHEAHGILEDRQGALWFGIRDQGLVRLWQGRLTAFGPAEGLLSRNIWCIHEDADGTLWLATDQGLARFREGKGFTFTTRQGLLENTVNCVLEDDCGCLWLSGLQGLCRVSRAELNAVAEGRAAQVQPVRLGTADGMENAETNGGENQPAGWKAHDGRLWFPTVRGLVVVDPRRVPLHESPPQVVIEQVKADEEVVLGDPSGSRIQPPGQGRERLLRNQAVSPAAYELKAGRARVLEFVYTANTFVAPEQARFRYRLVGADEDWREAVGERSARYINLRPGHYRFELLAANHHNVWSRQPATFAFTLAPQFWQTWTFYLGCAAGGIGLAAAVQGYRLRWQHRLLKLEEQRTLANERARIARDLHDDLGTALTGLALELDLVGREAQSPAPLSARLNETAQRTRELAERMREVVWTVNPTCDTVPSLASFLEQQVGQVLRAAPLRLRLDFPESLPSWPLRAEARHQLALAVREALTNVVRHAQATEVVVSLAVGGRELTVQITDNGRGFRPAPQTGHGLANQCARLAQVGGRAECHSVPGHGTTITFRLSLPPPAPPHAPANPSSA